MRRMTEGLNLSESPLPGVPLVELSGDCRVLIENHAGVTQYGTERICVKVSYGCLVICGCDLLLSRMTSGQLVIRGKIHSVSIQRGKDS